MGEVNGWPHADTYLPALYSSHQEAHEKPKNAHAKKIKAWNEGQLGATEGVLDIADELVIGQCITVKT